MIAGKVLYFILEYLGVISMSPAEKWDVFLKIFGLLGASGAAWWTISRWYLSKKIEYEVECLKNIAKITAHWNFLSSRAKSRENQDAIENIQKIVKTFEEIEKEITSSNLSFKKLREDNKTLWHEATYFDKYSELMFKNMELKKDSNKKSVAKPKQVE